MCVCVCVPERIQDDRRRTPRIMFVRGYAAPSISIFTFKDGTSSNNPGWSSTSIIVFQYDRSLSQSIMSALICVPLWNFFFWLLIFYKDFIVRDSWEKLRKQANWKSRIVPLSSLWMQSIFFYVVFIIL